MATWKARFRLIDPVKSFIRLTRKLY